MNQSARRNGIALLALALLVGCGGHGANGGQDDALKALKGLRDRGVLNEAEYQAKVATLQGTADSLAALKSLRDRGVLSEAEYQAKVATLQGTGSAGLGDGGNLGELAGTPAAASAPGVSGNSGAGLPASDNEFAGGTRAWPAREPGAATAAPQNAGRAVHNRRMAPGDSQPGEGADAAPSGNAPLSGLRKLLGQAHAKEQAVARSANDLAHRMLHRTAPATSSPGELAPTAKDARAAQSDRQGLPRSAGLSTANPDDAAGTPR